MERAQIETYTEEKVKEEIKNKGKQALDEKNVVQNSECCIVS
jgi:hypothetical protein